MLAMQFKDWGRERLLNECRNSGHGIEFAANPANSPSPRPHDTMYEANRNAARGEMPMAKATWNGTVIAEGDDVILVEGNCYFAQAAVKWDHFQKASNTTFCPWKGTASYYDIRVGAEVNPGAAWYYADPMPAAEDVRNRVAFWKGVEVEGAASAKPGPQPPPREGCKV
jgi:uncharacterized protein (DUF427 family)